LRVKPRSGAAEAKRLRVKPRSGAAKSEAFASQAVAINQNIEGDVISIPLLGFIKPYIKLRKGREAHDFKPDHSKQHRRIKEYYKN
jgi:hypothetical protein